MARVTIVFEDMTSGPMDGSARMEYEFDPAVTLTADALESYEGLTPAQRQALVAIGAVESHCQVLGHELSVPSEEE